MVDSRDNLNRRTFLKIVSGSGAGLLYAHSLNGRKISKAGSLNIDAEDKTNVTIRNPKTTVRLGLIHAKPVAGDLAANWVTFEHLAHKAANKAVDICVLPECFLDGYAVSHANWDRKQLLEAGRLVARQYLPQAKDLAGELNIMLLFCTTYTTGDCCYNSAFLIGANGKHIGRYDKTHLLEHDLRFDAGKKLPVFDTPFGKVGIMICADRRWPETARTLRVQGAKLILNPSYGMRHLKNEWWMRTRSYENECYICFVHPTLSLITDPKGDIHDKISSTEPGLLISTVNMSNVPTEMFDARRPELYAPITRTKQSVD